MAEHIRKDIRALTFRTRLAAGLVMTGLSQAALARATGTDRSTISQLLSDGSARLPNAQVVAECARALDVSADWLLGLTERPERGAQLIAASVAMPEAPRALIDEQLFAWHVAAAGQKIRHVPAHLPDMLKTPAFMAWEYEPALGRTTEQAIGAAADRLGRIASGASDYEFCLPLHEMRAMARSEGYYAGLPPAVARAQIAHMADLIDRLFPALRLSLYDGRRFFSVPLTVFGQTMAALYLGQTYMVFHDGERVRALARHVDILIRESTVVDRDCGRWVRALKT